MRTSIVVKTTTTNAMNTTTQKPTELTLAKQLATANSQIKKLTDKNKFLKNHIGDLKREISERKQRMDMGGALGTR